MAVSKIRIPNAPNFYYAELVPPEVYEQFRSRPQYIAQLFKPGVIDTAQALRKTFGPMTINNWHVHKDGHKYRAYRPFDCSVGAQFSQHKFGSAIDAMFADVTAEEARQYILSNPDKFPFISALEGGVNWLHFDGRPRLWQGIQVFNP